MPAHSSVWRFRILQTLLSRHHHVCPLLQAYVAFTAKADALDAHHRFVAEECDWGFTRFVDLRKLYTPDPASGKPKPTIENDEVEITAFVRVLKDPTGVLWHNFVKYVSLLVRGTWHNGETISTDGQL